MKIGDLVKYSFSTEESQYIYGIGVILSFSRSGEFANVWWTGKGVLWSTVKHLRIVSEVERDESW